MGVLEANTTLIYGVHIRESANDGSDFSNAAADYRVLFLGEDGQLHLKDSSGNVTAVLVSGYQYGATTFTSGVNITATTEATANTVVTAPATAFDGATGIYIEFYAFSIRPRTDGASGTLNLYLYDDTGGGAASIGRVATFITPAAAGDNKPCLIRHYLTPSAATHTYSIRGAVSGGTGNVGAGAGGNAADMPGYIRLFKH